MAFYYDLNRALTSNGSALTESTHFRLATVANQETCRLMSLYGTCRGGTAGGGSLRVKTWATASTGGTSQTPAKKNPNSPAASVTAFNDATAITPGTTAVVRLSIGVAQTGGTGGYVPTEKEAPIALLANGGANGNLDLLSIFNATSQAFDAFMDLAEGA